MAMNASVAIPLGGQFYLLDLGNVRLVAPPDGTYRWGGIVEAYAAANGDPVSIDCIYLQPIDDGGGHISSSFAGTQYGTPFSTFDNFNESVGGALTGATAVIGGAWSGAGATGDFLAEGGYAQRTTSGDSAAAGRIDTIGSSIAAVVVQCDVEANASISTQGVVARFSSATNYVAAVIQSSSGLLSIRKKVSSSIPTFMANVYLGTGQWTAGTWWTIRFATDAAGRYWLWWGPQGQPLTAMFAGQDSNLATGGGLASGTVGLYDEQDSGTVTRQYENFQSWALTADAAIFANRSAELRYDSMLRQDSTGTYYRPASLTAGDLARVPNSGLEGRAAQLFVKATRGDIDPLPDSGLDGLSVQIKYRPAFIFRP